MAAVNSLTSCCPVCGEEFYENELFDGLCAECLADDIRSGISDSILYDYIRDNFSDFCGYIRDNFNG
ncbi:MAG: hypothetical protein ACI4JJ_05240 [Huintestinicola sp.]